LAKCRGAVFHGHRFYNGQTGKTRAVNGTDVACTDDSLLPAKADGKEGDVDEAPDFSKFVNSPDFHGIATRTGVEYSSRWVAKPVPILFLTASRIGGIFPYSGAARLKFRKYASDNSFQTWADRGYDIFFLAKPQEEVSVNFFQNSDILQTTLFVDLNHFDEYGGAFTVLERYPSLASAYYDGENLTSFGKDNFSLIYSNCMPMGLSIPVSGRNLYLIFIVAVGKYRSPTETCTDFLIGAAKELKSKFLTN